MAKEPGPATGRVRVPQVPRVRTRRRHGRRRALVDERRVVRGPSSDRLGRRVPIRRAPKRGAAARRLGVPRSRCLDRRLAMRAVGARWGADHPAPQQYPGIRRRKPRMGSRSRRDSHRTNPKRRRPRYRALEILGRSDRGQFDRREPINGFRLWLTSDGVACPANHSARRDASETARTASWSSWGAKNFSRMPVSCEK